MPSVVPPQLPEITRDEATAFLAEVGLAQISKAVLFGRRGYFADFNEPGNEYGIFDDAIVLISPTTFATYNANTDPSIKRPKVAVLQPGKWIYKVGTHNLSKPPDKRYKALVQAGEVEVFRPATEPEVKGTRSDLGLCQGAGKWRGWFGVNIHRGGLNTTGSEGCQTIYKPQWDAFMSQTEMEMKRHQQPTIEYYLTVH